MKFSGQLSVSTALPPMKELGGPNSGGLFMIFIIKSRKIIDVLLINSVDYSK
jgi:hypothetical protein